MSSCMINGEQFNDEFCDEGSGDGYVKYELYEMRQDDETLEDDETLDVTIHNVNNGFVINDNVYLTVRQWHTIIEQCDNMYRCAVCEVYCEQKALNEHIIKENHLKNLEAKKPLKRFDLSIVRKINNAYHCGVCNIIIDIQDINIHENAKEHEGNMLFAINKVSDLDNGLTDNGLTDNENNDNANNRLTSNRLNVTGNNGNVAANNMDNNVAMVNSLWDFSNLDTDNSYSYSVANNSCSDNSSRNRFNNSCSDNNTNNRFNNSYSDNSSNNRFNNSHSDNNTNNRFNNGSNNNVWYYNPVVSEDVDNYSLPQAGFSYANMASKPKIEMPRYLKINFNGIVVRVKFEHWHMVVDTKLNEVFCMACKEVLLVRFKMQHCLSEVHNARLRQCYIVDVFDDFLVRQVDEKLYHCSECNNLHYGYDMQTHIETTHPKRNKNLIDETITKRNKKERVTDNSCKNVAGNSKNNVIDINSRANYTENRSKNNVPENNTRNIVTDNIRSNVDNCAVNTVAGKSCKNNVLDNCSKNNRSRNNTPGSATKKTVAETVVNNSNLNTITLEKQLNITSFITINPFGNLLNISLLSFNTVLELNGENYCALCDVICKIPLKHISEMEHGHVLGLTPFIRKFQNHLIRAIKNTLHCTLCNKFVKINEIYDHNLENLHTEALATALGVIKTQVPAINVKYAPIMNNNSLTVKKDAAVNNDNSSENNSYPNNDNVHFDNVIDNVNSITQTDIKADVTTVRKTQTDTERRLNSDGNKEINSNPGINGSNKEKYKLSAKDSINNDSIKRNILPRMLGPKRTNINTRIFKSSQSNLKTPIENRDITAKSNENKIKDSNLDIFDNNNELVEKENDCFVKVTQNVIKVGPNTVDNLIDSVTEHLSNAGQIINKDKSQNEIDLIDFGQQKSESENIDFTKANQPAKTGQHSNLIEMSQIEIAESHNLNINKDSQAFINKKQREDVKNSRFDSESSNNDQSLVGKDENTKISKFDTDSNAKNYSQSDSESSNNGQSVIGKDQNTKMSKFDTDAKNYIDKDSKHDDSDSNANKDIDKDSKHEDNDSNAKNYIDKDSKHEDSDSNADKDKDSDSINEDSDSIAKKYIDNGSIHEDSDSNANKDIDSDSEDIKARNYKKTQILKIKSKYFELPNLSYNTMVLISGARYCFVCAVTVPFSMVYEHMDSRTHLETLAEAKFVDKYGDHFLRQMYLIYHCAFCNTLMSRKEIKSHLQWPVHENKRKDAVKDKTQARKLDITNFHTQKEGIYLNEKENLFKIVSFAKKKQFEAKNKIVIINNDVLKINFESWHGFSNKMCMLCNDTNIDTASHMESKKHVELLEKDLQANYYPDLLREIDHSIHCITCNILMPNTDFIVKEHIRGKKHVKIYKNILKEGASVNNYEDCSENVLYL